MVNWNNKEEVIEAVKNDGKMIEHASEELQNDPEVMIEAIKNWGCAFIYASEELQNDREIVMEAVKNWGQMIEHASKELRNDPEIAMEAFKKCGSWALIWISNELKKDKKFMSKLSKGNLWFYNKEKVIELVKMDGIWAIIWLSEELTNDPEIKEVYNTYENKQKLLRELLKKKDICIKDILWPEVV